MVVFTVLRINWSLELLGVVWYYGNRFDHRFPRHHRGLYQDLPPSEVPASPIPQCSTSTAEKALAEYGEVQENSVRHDVGVRGIPRLLHALLDHRRGHRCKTHAPDRLHPGIRLHIAAAELLFEPVHLLPATARNPRADHQRTADIPVLE